MRKILRGDVAGRRGAVRAASFQPGADGSADRAGTGLCVGTPILSMLPEGTTMGPPASAAFDSKGHMYVLNRGPVRR